MSAARLAGALALIALLGSGVARAASPSSDARRLYAEGKAEYAQGHYEQAVALFELSYALSESPALLFNMAQAHRLAGPAHCVDAVKLYKSYLAASPAAENRREVEERIVQLGECPAPPAQETVTRPAQPPVAQPAAGTRRPPPPALRRSPPTGPVLLAGSGSALLVAGGVLYWRAWEKHREAEKRCPCYPGTYSSWEVLSNVSYALLAVGGATLAGGVTWWVVGQPPGAGQPSRAMLGVSGRF